MVMMIKWLDIPDNAPLIFRISIINLFDNRSLSSCRLNISLYRLNNLAYKIEYLDSICQSPILALDNPAKGTISKYPLNFIAMVKFFPFLMFVMWSLMSFLSRWRSTDTAWVRVRVRVIGFTRWWARRRWWWTLRRWRWWWRVWVVSPFLFLFPDVTRWWMLLSVF